MAILVTNDDGYTEGLRILLEAVKKVDKHSYAVIPNRQRSAVSKSMTLHKALRIYKREKDICEVNGTPADCVTMALHLRKFKRPKLVVSGVNSGDNTSLHSVFSSGTIGACTEAVLHHIPAIAFSKRKRVRDWRMKENWKEEDEIKKVIWLVLKKLNGRIPRDTIYSVNMPREMAKAKIVVIPRLQRHLFTVEIEKRLDPNKEPYYWIAGGDAHIEENTDVYEIRKRNNIVVTPLSIDPIRKENVEKAQKIFHQKASRS